MKPFSLQTVLDCRKRLEETAQHRLLETKNLREKIKQKLQGEIDTLTRLIEECEKLQREGIGITELIRYEERISSRQLNIQAIKKNLVEKSALVEKEQQNLRVRCRERQIMERLKATQNKAWQTYVDKKEAAMLDEIATTRHDSNSF